MSEHWTRETYYNIKKTQYSDMWRASCPFCDFDSDDQKELIVWRGKHWYILRNKFPYTNTGKHIMVIPYKHKCVATDLDSDEFSELKEVHEFVKSYFWDIDYFSFTRETFANRSLEHYHLHFLNWKLQWKFLRKMLNGQWLFE